MENLIKNLKEQTQELKAIYLEKTESWSKAEFERLFKMTDTSIRVLHGYDSRNEWPVGHKYRNETNPENYMRHTKASYAYAQKVGSIKYKGLEIFVETNLKMANMHYDQSIAKLADRIIKKGLNQDNLILSSSRIEMNFETIITDGNKKVRAFTILAEGEIQRPHYRYLVK